ncbi:hypothetical protein SLE2022_314010 [Rubroshorea leprosula]
MWLKFSPDWVGRKGEEGRDPTVIYGVHEKRMDGRRWSNRDEVADVRCKIVFFCGLGFWAKNLWFGLGPALQAHIFA